MWGKVVCLSFVFAKVTRSEDKTIANFGTSVVVDKDGRVASPPECTDSLELPAGACAAKLAGFIAEGQTAQDVCPEPSPGCSVCCATCAAHGVDCATATQPEDPRQVLMSAVWEVAAGIETAVREQLEAAEGCDPVAFVKQLEGYAAPHLVERWAEGEHAVLANKLQVFIAEVMLGPKFGAHFPEFRDAAAGTPKATYVAAFKVHAAEVVTTVSTYFDCTSDQGVRSCSVDTFARGVMVNGIVLPDRDLCENLVDKDDAIAISSQYGGCLGPIPRGEGGGPALCAVCCATCAARGADCSEHPPKTIRELVAH